MQRVALERKVECVTADLARRLQPGRERELPRFAGERTRQQPMLDLCGKRQRNRPLPPLEEVGVAAVRDHNVCEEMPGERDICHGLLRWEIVQPQLEDADRFAAAGHRREQASAVVLGDHLDGLTRQGPSVRRPEQWHTLGSLLALQPQDAGSARVAQSDQ